MTLGDFFANMGNYLFLELGAAVIGLMLALVVSVRLFQKKPTSGALLALPGLFVGMVVLALTILGSQTLSLESLSIAIGARLLGPLVLWPSTMLVLVCAAVAGLRAEQRSWKVAGTVVVATVLTTMIPWGYGYVGEDYLLVGTRSFLYLMAGALCAVSCIGVSDTAGRDAGVAGAASYALVVAGGELLQRAVTFAFLVLQLPTVAPKNARLFYDVSHETLIAKFSPWDHVTMVCALTPLLVLVGLALREDGARNRAILALPVVLVAPALYLIGDPSVEAVVALCNAMH
jgi:hypothetical protein